MNRLPQHIGDQIADHLEAIADLFKAPKLTLVIRSPQLNDGDVVITTDDLDAAIRAIEQLKSTESHPV